LVRENHCGPGSSEPTPGHAKPITMEGAQLRAYDKNGIQLVIHLGPWRNKNLPFYAKPDARGRRAIKKQLELYFARQLTMTTDPITIRFEWPTESRTLLIPDPPGGANGVDRDGVVHVQFTRWPSLGRATSD